MQFKNIGIGNVTVADFSRMNLAFADKTPFIKDLEDRSCEAVVFLRPRRFGKTLFTRILFNYYDRSLAGKFDENFNGTWIHSHRTPRAGSYYCLNFDFSRVVPDSRESRDSFILAVAAGISYFSRRYPDKGFPEEALDPKLYSSASDLIGKFLMSFVRRAKDGERLYVIIDEYDHFANEVLSKDSEAFRDLTSTAEQHDGMIKTFYTTLKSYSGRDAGSCIDRFYITGVSSVSLSSLTSGFNICSNISDNPKFNAMAGFTHDELSKIIDETVDFSTLGKITKKQVMTILEQRYDGYLFSESASESIFCPNMCLTFLSRLITNKKIPPLLSEGTLSADVANLDGMMRLAEPWARDQLEEKIFRKESVRVILPQALNLNEHNLFDMSEAASMLMYLGFLTAEHDSGDDDAPDDLMNYRCPNEASYQVFLNYIQSLTGLGRWNQTDLSMLEEKGDIRPLIDAVALFIRRMKDSSFAGFNERTLQTVFYFTVKDSARRGLTVSIEYDTGAHGRADLFIQNRRPGSRQLLLELKYLSKARGTDQAVAAKLNEAKEQLRRYRAAPNFCNVRNLDCWSVVFVNSEPEAVEKLT